jgi:hypothetical protein
MVPRRGNRAADRVRRDTLQEETNTRVIAATYAHKLECRLCQLTWLYQR